MGSSPGSCKPDYKIGICCLSAKHTALKKRAKTGWLGIRIMCPSGATCLLEDDFVEIRIPKKFSGCRN